jgi:hypothetical protein
MSDGKTYTEADLERIVGERVMVAAEKGVPAKYLRGTTRDELEAAADEYLKDHPAATGEAASGPKPDPAEMARTVQR